MFTDVCLTLVYDEKRKVIQYLGYIEFGVFSITLFINILRKRRIKGKNLTCSPHMYRTIKKMKDRENCYMFLFTGRIEYCLLHSDK